MLAVSESSPRCRTRRVLQYSSLHPHRKTLRNASRLSRSICLLQDTSTYEMHIHQCINNPQKAGKRRARAILVPSPDAHRSLESVRTLCATGAALFLIRATQPALDMIRNAWVHSCVHQAARLGLTRFALPTVVAGVPLLPHLSHTEREIQAAARVLGRPDTAPDGTLKLSKEEQANRRIEEAR